MIDLTTTDMLNFAETTGAWLITTTVRVAVLGLAVAVFDRVLARRLWPEVRAALWWLVVVVAVLPPLFESPVSVWHWGDPAVRLDAYLTDTGATDEADMHPVWKALYPEHFATVAREPTLRQQAVRLAPVLWLGVFALLSVAAVWRAVRLRRAWLDDSTGSPPAWLDPIQQRCAAKLGLRRFPRIIVHAGPFGPAVIGSWRPRVVLPAQLLAEASPDEIEHILLHEFAHVHRRDALASRLCMFVHLLFWFHPILWLARTRLETLREICCDQTVVRALRHRGPAYRQTLLRMAESLLAQPARIGFVNPYSQIMARLAYLQRPGPRRLGSIRACSSIIFAVLLACCIPRTATTEPRDEPEPAIILSELPGCMQLRFAVMGAIANRANAKENEIRRAD